MGILDGIVEWLATQIMNLLDLLSTSVLGALGCNMWCENADECNLIFETIKI